MPKKQFDALSQAEGSDDDSDAGAAERGLGEQLRELAERIKQTAAAPAERTRKTVPLPMIFLIMLCFAPAAYYMMDSAASLLASSPPPPPPPPPSPSPPPPSASPPSPSPPPHPPPPTPPPSPTAATVARTSPLPPPSPMPPSLPPATPSQPLAPPPFSYDLTPPKDYTWPGDHLLRNYKCAGRSLEHHGGLVWPAEVMQAATPQLLDYYMYRAQSDDECERIP